MLSPGRVVYPRLVGWHLIFGGGKPTFLTEHILESLCCSKLTILNAVAPLPNAFSLLECPCHRHLFVLTSGKPYHLTVHPNFV